MSFEDVAITLISAHENSPSPSYAKQNSGLQDLPKLNDSIDQFESQISDNFSQI
jgi:hypothetical protein